MTKVVSFFGADHKCGAGMISQCIAERIAAVAPKLKVLLIHTNGRSCTEYSPTVSESMDNIRPYLADQLLDSHEILEKSRWKDNLYIIAGSQELGSASLYDPAMTNYMLEALDREFDLLICDSGCEIEHGLSLGSLIAAENIWMVLTQNESALRRYEWQRPLMEKLHLKTDRFVINKYDKSNPYNCRYITERLNLDPERTFTVRQSEYGGRAEYDERSLVNYPGSGFRKEIDAVAAKILEDAGLRMTPPR